MASDRLFSNADDCASMRSSLAAGDTRLRWIAERDGLGRYVPYQSETWPQAIVRAGPDLVMA